MKILYIANVAAEHICKFYINEFRELEKRGFEIDLACRKDAEVPYVHHFYPMPWNRNPFHLSTIKGIGIVKQLIIKNHYDLVYCTTPIGGLVGRLAVKQIGSFHPAVIYIAHGFHFFHGSSIWSWIIYYPFERYLSKFTDVLITVNDEDYSLAQRKMKAKAIYEINEIGANIQAYLSVTPTKEWISMEKKVWGLNRNFLFCFTPPKSLV
jgi:glycosyltransferase EpsD